MRAMHVSAVDYHTGGEPFRIVDGGVGSLRGRTILDKRRYASQHLDEVRQLLVYEPRGHADMYGGFVTDAEDDGADIGVVFFHNEGYSTACGHGTIALVTWALETGRIPVTGRETSVIVDVPSGRLPTTATVEGDVVTSVRFRNVPSFVVMNDLRLTTSRGEVSCDISFGGAFYASVDVAGVGLRVHPEDLDELIDLGRQIKRTIEAGREIVHPVEPELRDVYGVIFFEHQGEGEELRQRNVTIFADGEVDRSPCGSGTSARLALLHQQGRLATGQRLVHEGIVGSRFDAWVVDETDLEGTPAVITEVEGSAHLSGYHHFVLRPGDDLGTGFLLR